MKTVTAIYDGRVFVPEQPVQLAKNRIVLITIPDAATPAPAKPVTGKPPKPKAAPPAQATPEAPPTRKCLYGPHLTPEERKARNERDLYLLNKYADELNAESADVALYGVDLWEGDPSRWDVLL